MTVVPHFVCPDDRFWPELRTPKVRTGSVPDIPPSVLRIRSVNGFDCWVTRIYYELRRAGRAATIGPEVAPGRVNIVGARDFGRRQARADAFFLIARGDAHQPALAQFTVYQNGVLGRGPTWDWVPMFGQPDLIPRLADRGGQVARMVFKGADRNLDPRFKSEAFRAALSELGVELRLDAILVDGGDNNWGDYADTDAVLAVRDLTREDARHKPASKLVNAWFAEVPALLGPEPAYRELRQSELDYLEVCTTQDVLAALRRLRERPDLYAAMVENGRQRRDAFSDAALRMRWGDVLDGPVAQAFERWRRQNGLVRRMGFVRRILLEPINKARHQRAARSGERILPPE